MVAINLFNVMNFNWCKKTKDVFKTLAATSVICETNLISGVQLKLEKWWNKVGHCVKRQQSQNIWPKITRFSCKSMFIWEKCSSFDLCCIFPELHPHLSPLPGSLFDQHQIVLDRPRPWREPWCTCCLGWSEWGLVVGYGIWQVIY